MTRALLAAVLVLGLGLRSAVAADCPDYVAHLQSARAYLAHGERQAAATELRAARKALDACALRAAPSEAMALR